MFTQTVEQMSESRSANTHVVLSEISRAMNTPIDARRLRGSEFIPTCDVGLKPDLPLRPWANQFPYVNGGLFSGSAYYRKLDAMHLVVNVFKHGKGSSLTSLKERYPDYLENLFADLDVGNIDSLDHTSLKIKDGQIDEFSEAILAFWQDVPERIFDDCPSDTSLPNWFEKAGKKDCPPREKT